MNLQDILDKAGTLKPTATVVRDKQGKVTIERDELLSSNVERQKLIDASIAAGKLRFQSRIFQGEEATTASTYPITKGQIFEYIKGEGSWQPLSRLNEETNNHGLRDETPIHPTAPSSTATVKTAVIAPVKAAGTTASSSTASSSSSMDTIRIATYNVWFSQYEWEARLEALVDMLLKHRTASCSSGNGALGESNIINTTIEDDQNPNQEVEEDRVHVLCLQEVTPRFLAKLLKYECIQENYYVAHGAVRTYGVCMLVCKDMVDNMQVIPDILEVTLPTKMGRAGLIVIFQHQRHPKSNTGTTATYNEGVSDAESHSRSAGIGSSPYPLTAKTKAKTFAICTVHLESLNSKAIRTQQLEVLCNALDKYDTVIFCGDFNISGTGPWANPEEHDAITSKLLCRGYYDLWVREHGTEGDNETSPGYNHGVTFDSKSNKMVQTFSNFHDSARYDRAYVKDSEDNDTKKDNNNNIIPNDDDGEERLILGSWKAQNIRIIGNKPIVKKKEQMLKKKEMDGITTSTVATATSSQKPLLPPTVSSDDSDDNTDDPLYISDHFGLLWTITREE